MPPRIEARINVTGALDPVLLDMQERMRAHAMYPKRFDVKFSDVQTSLGIYRLDGDRLTLCVDDGTDQPTEFKSAEGTRTILFRLKREKP